MAEKQTKPPWIRLRHVLGGALWECPLAAWNGLAGATASDTQFPLYVPKIGSEWLNDQKPSLKYKQTLSGFTADRVEAPVCIQISFVFPLLDIQSRHLVLGGIIDKILADRDGRRIYGAISVYYPPEEPDVSVLILKSS